MCADLCYHYNLPGAVNPVVKEQPLPSIMLLKPKLDCACSDVLLCKLHDACSRVCDSHTDTNRVQRTVLDRTPSCV
jgi:hypothetical protein